MSVPAAVRHRWKLDDGGPVDVIDLGFRVLTVPAGDAQCLLGDLLSREDHAAFVASLADDLDLAATWVASHSTITSCARVPPVHRGTAVPASAGGTCGRRLQLRRLVHARSCPTPGTADGWWLRC
jgi:hypothetical protein